MSTLTDIGEFGLIDLIKKKFTPYGPETVVGIDDDCAVVTGREGFYTLYTCDSQVEGSHFITDLVPLFTGTKVLSVNSDIAPWEEHLVALLSLVFTRSTIRWIDTFRRFRYKTNDMLLGYWRNTAHTGQTDRCNILGEVKTFAEINMLEI